MRCLPILAALAVGTFPATARADEEPSSVGDPWRAVPAVLDAPEPIDAPVDRRALSAGLVVGGYTVFGSWAYYAWYYGVPPLPQFTFAGDGYFGAETYAGGADKLGHAWANHVLTRASYRILRWGGWDRVEAAVIAGGVAQAFFTLVEVKDGYYYQMSPGDLVANAAGSALALAMEFEPRLDELLDFRVQYWPSDEYRAIVNGEAEAEINTVNIAEDYSGQTYLLALHLGPIRGLGEGRWTRWTRYVDAVVGFNADNYKPDPLPDSEVMRRQSLFLGVSLNAQGIVDDLLAGGGARRHVRAIGHGVFEMMNLPFTTLPAGGLDRSPVD